jgi:hypothetical protein
MFKRACGVLSITVLSLGIQGVAVAGPSTAVGSGQYVQAQWAVKTFERNGVSHYRLWIAGGQRWQSASGKLEVDGIVGRGWCVLGPTKGECAATGWGVPVRANAVHIDPVAGTASVRFSFRGVHVRGAWTRDLGADVPDAWPDPWTGPDVVGVDAWITEPSTAIGGIGPRRFTAAQSRGEVGHAEIDEFAAALVFPSGRYQWSSSFRR